MEIGLNEEEIAIFFQYGLDGLSFQEIAPSVQMRNHQQVNRKYQKVRSKLEDAGFKQWLVTRVKSKGGRDE